MISTFSSRSISFTACSNIIFIRDWPAALAESSGDCLGEVSSLPSESSTRVRAESKWKYMQLCVRMQYQITIGTRQQIIFLWTMTKCDDKTQEYLVFIGHSYLKQKFHRTGKVWLIKTRTKYAKSDGFHLLHKYFERVFMLKMLNKLWFCQFQLKCWIWLIKYFYSELKISLG